MRVLALPRDLFSKIPEYFVGIAYPPSLRHSFVPKNPLSGNFHLQHYEHDLIEDRNDLIQLAVFLMYVKFASCTVKVLPFQRSSGQFGCGLLCHLTLFDTEEPGVVKCDLAASPFSKEDLVIRYSSTRIHVRYTPYVPDIPKTKGLGGPIFAENPKNTILWGPIHKNHLVHIIPVERESCAMPVFQFLRLRDIDPLSELAARRFSKWICTER